MGADIADFEPGGGRSECFGSLLQGGMPAGVAVWGGDVGPDPQGGAGPEYLSEQGSATAHKDAEEEVGGWSWDYPPLSAAMEEVGFEDIGAYVTRRQNTVA